MLKNYLKIKFSTLVLLGTLLTGHVFAQTHTRENFKEKEEESNRLRKEYLEKRTNSEFFKINEKIRHEEYEKYKKERAKSVTARTTSVETIANGNLNGEWIEKRQQESGWPHSLLRFMGAYKYCVCSIRWW